MYNIQNIHIFVIHKKITLTHSSSKRLNMADSFSSSPTNFAIERYYILDELLYNNGYDNGINNIEELIKRVNERLDYDKQIAKRQLYNDISYIETKYGGKIKRHGVNRYQFIYKEPFFSIKKILSEEHTEIINNHLQLLKKTGGIPELMSLYTNFIETMSTSTSPNKQQPDSDIIVYYDNNEKIKGINHWSGLYWAIEKKENLKIRYQSFKQPKPEQFEISPTQLKKYNNRWFLLGYNLDLHKITTMALDRIISFEIDKSFRYHSSAISTSKEHIEKIETSCIGVTLNEDEGKQTVRICIAKSLWSYFETKPLKTQQVLEVKENGDVICQLDLYINMELKQIFYSHADRIEIISPESLRNEFKETANNLSKLYK